MAENDVKDMKKNYVGSLVYPAIKDERVEVKLSVEHNPIGDYKFKEKLEK